MMQTFHPSQIRNITVSGRIASGASTLAERLTATLTWRILHGGDLFREFSNDHGYADKRSDAFDLAYEKRVQHILQNETHHIVESQLAGFDAQQIDGVYKILVSCEDENGDDKLDIRIDRLVNRDTMTVADAKHEVQEREQQNLILWRRLYAHNNPDWVYWQKKYYDMVINTYSHNADEGVRLVMEAIAGKII